MDATKFKEVPKEQETDVQSRYTEKWGECLDKMRPEKIIALSNLCDPRMVGKDEFIAVLKLNPGSVTDLVRFAACAALNTYFLSRRYRFPDAFFGLPEKE